MLYRLPGGRIAFSTLADTVRGAPIALELIAGGARRIIRSSRSRGRDLAAREMQEWGRRVVQRLDIDLELRGLDHIDTTEQYVVAPLHEGFLDVPALLHLPLPLRFAVREELAEWRTLGRVIRATDQIVIDTTRPRSGLRELMRRGRDADGDGESVVVFPQGSVLGIEVAFQQGAAALGRHLGRRILPVVLTGSHRVWDYPFGPRVRFGQRVTLEVLAPVEPECLQKVETVMKSLALSGDRAPARRFDPLRDGFWDGYAYEIDPTFEDLATAIRDHRAGPPTGSAL